MNTPFTAKSRVEIRWMSPPPSGLVKVNGLPVHPRGAETRWEAALRQVARIASRQEGSAEAVIITPGEPDRYVRVDQTGSVDELLSPGRGIGNETPVTEKLHEPAALDSGWRPQAPQEAGMPNATRRSRKALREPTRVRVSLPAVVAAAAAVVLVAAGVSVYSLNQNDSESALQVAVAPLGYRANAAWSVDSVATSVNVVPVVGGIAYVGEDRSLRVVEAKSGAVRWEGRVPVGEVKTDPAVMIVDGQACLVTLVDNQLLWWSLDTGEPHSVEVPAEATLFLGEWVPL